MRFGDERRELGRHDKLAMRVMSSFVASSASPFLLRRWIRRSNWRAAAAAKEAGKTRGGDWGFGDARRRLAARAAVVAVLAQRILRARQRQPLDGTGASAISPKKRELPRHSVCLTIERYWEFATCRLASL